MSATVAEIQSAVEKLEDALADLVQEAVSQRAQNVGPATVRLDSGIRRVKEALSILNASHCHAANCDNLTAITHIDEAGVYHYYCGKHYHEVVTATISVN